MTTGKRSWGGSVARERHRTGDRPRLAFTLVELLVVIAILGALVALVLPAYQAAREASRSVTCKNNLKQIGSAVHLHLNAHRHFPTGGWGFAWTGDADRGYGRLQPGGWVYNLLPYLEQANLHDLGAGLAEPQKRAVAARRMEVPLPAFACPSRRAAVQYPVASFSYANRMVNADPPQFVTRSDYAINVGTTGQITFVDGGPKSIEGAKTTFVFPNPKDYTGISFAGSEVEARQVEGGMNNTLLVGEKYLNSSLYDTSDDPSDWGHMYSGLARDACRLAGTAFLLDRDKPEISRLSIFGGAHLHCHFAYCDGSVHALGYDVEPEVYEKLADRNE